MAYNINKINPLDLQPRVAIGIDLPFSKDIVFRSTYTSKEAIRANLINFFLTGKRERILNPDFGAGLRSLLFENINENLLQTVKDDIIRLILKNFPRILITNFNLIFENNILSIVFNYKVKETNIEDEILINIQG